VSPGGAISFGSSGSSYGTSGQVLTSTGSGTTPAWSTLSYLPLSGGSLTGGLYLASDPGAPNQAATKNYVDNAINGLSWKDAALAATTTNITLSGEQTIDGILTSSSRILVKNQTTASQNGVYVSSSGTWTRATDVSTGTEILGAALFVQEGGSNANTAWVVSNTSAITVGTTSINFTQFGSGATYTAGTGLTLLANQFSLTNSSVTVSAGTGLSGGGTVSLGGTITLSNSGVTSLTGTANQINVSSASGSVTLSLPSTINVNTTGSAASITGTYSGSLTSTQVTNALGFTPYAPFVATLTTASTRTSTTTPSMDATLVTGTLVQGATYSFSANLACSSTGAGGIQIGIAFTAGIAISDSIQVAHIASNGVQANVIGIPSIPNAVQYNPGGGFSTGCTITGTFVVPSGYSGGIGVSWCQYSSNSAASVLGVGSSLVVTRLA